MATSALRRGPDFVIIGAKRGGTTSLYRYLHEHPSIQPLFPGRQHVKGVHYYDSNYERGLRWYRSHFPLEAGGRHLVRPARRPAIAGEASPYYLFHPLAAERLARDFPGVRIIVNLRDPVDRAYSHYKEELFPAVRRSPLRRRWMPRTTGCAVKPNASQQSRAISAPRTSTLLTWPRAGTLRCSRAGSPCSRATSSTSW